MDKITEKQAHIPATKEVMHERGLLKYQNSTQTKEVFASIGIALVGLVCVVAAVAFCVFLVSIAGAGVVVPLGLGCLLIGGGGSAASIALAGSIISCRVSSLDYRKQNPTKASVAKFMQVEEEIESKKSERASRKQKKIQSKETAKAARIEAKSAIVEARREKESSDLKAFFEKRFKKLLSPVMGHLNDSNPWLEMKQVQTNVYKGHGGTGDDVGKLSDRMEELMKHGLLFSVDTTDLAERKDSKFTRHTRDTVTYFEKYPDTGVLAPLAVEVMGSDTHESKLYHFDGIGDKCLPEALQIVHENIKEMEANINEGKDYKQSKAEKEVVRLAKEEKVKKARAAFIEAREKSQAIVKAQENDRWLAKRQRQDADPNKSVREYCAEWDRICAENPGIFRKES